jgi:PGF-pre-PGF domain-containing protein/LPXTG-motif cell wall-anchored protein
MTNEKKKRVVGKNEILILLGTLILVGFLSFVFSGFYTQSGAAITKGNFSGSIVLNCSGEYNLNFSGAYKGINASFFYNESGGPTSNTTTGTGSGFLALVWNTTTNYTAFNMTVNVSSFPDANGFFRAGYNFSCLISNGTNFTVASAGNVTIDNNPPNVIFIATNVSNNGNYSANAILVNVSVIDIGVGMSNVTYGMGPVGEGAGNVYLNISNSSGGKAPTNNFTRLYNTSGTNWTGGYFVTNVSIDTTSYPDGKYNLTIFANESSKYALINSAGTAVWHSNNSERIQITIDRTAPTTPVLTNTTSTTTTQIVATITDTDATSGIDSCVAGGSPAPIITGRGTGTQTLTYAGLECGHSYNFVVTCYDQVGNSNVSTTSLSTSSCSVSDSGPGGGTTPTTTLAVEKKFSLNILPAQEAVLSNFQETMGVEEIKIRVNEVANNVKVTVKKFDTQPSEISVPKTGQVHKYIQISTENLGAKLEGATLEFKVQKNWLLDNGIDKANIALFKFDESAGEWKELTSIYKEEDTTYYYYDAQVTSFSFFAIGEKSVTLPEAPEEEAAAVTTKFLQQNWIWIVIGVVVLLGIIGGLFATKKKKRK